MHVRELIDILNEQPPDAEVELAVIAPVDEDVRRHHRRPLPGRRRAAVERRRRRGPRHLADRRRGRRRRRLPRRRRAGRRLSRGRAPAMAARTRSWWGWGWEDEAVADDEMLATARGRLAERFGVELDDRRSARRRRPRPARAPDRAARRARRLVLDRPVRPGRAHLRQVVPRRRARRPRRPARIHPTSSPSRRPRPTSSPCSTGARRRTSRRSPTAAARRSSAVSSAPSATASPASCRSTSPASTGSSRSTRCPGPRASRAARSGPVLEDQLRPHGYTLRHFPQSFEFSTLGGWLATRSGGHYASVYTHIDDLVESMRVVTPDGRQRVPPAARVRRRAVARPPLPRLRRQPRRHHRGVDARAGPAALAGVGGGRLRRLRRRRRRRPAPSRSPGCSRPTAACSTAPRPCVGGGDGGRRRAARARLRVGRPPRRRVDRRGRSSCAATTAATIPAGVSTSRRARTAADAARDDAVGSWRIVVPARALPARRARAVRRDRRDVRDGVHLGRVRRAPRRRHRRRSTDALHGSAAAAG